MTIRVRFKNNWVVDAAVPNGVQRGYNADDELVCIVQFDPEYAYVLGDHATEAEVVEWHVSVEHGERLATRQRHQRVSMEWFAAGTPCEGEA